MNRPEDIPEDVLALAEKAYLKAIYMTTNDEPLKMVEMVARAILSERAAQKERDAKIADKIAAALREVHTSHAPSQSAQAMVIGIVDNVASAIRSQNG